MGVEQMTALDLSYAPPFSPVWDPVLIAARLHSFFNVVATPGGSLGGERQTWNATLDMNLTGTGALTGYVRFVQIAVAGETTESMGAATTGRSKR